MRASLDCLILGKKVMVQVLIYEEEGSRPPHDRAIWTATFQDPGLVAETDLSAEDAVATGWSPENEDPNMQIGKMLGRVINIQPRGPDQLSILLHLGLHNLLEAARKALKEE